VVAGYAYGAIDDVVTAPADLVFGKAEDLLSCLESVLSKYDAEACRTFIAPGNPPPWDTCCDCGTGEGMAYVQIASVAPTDNFPSPQTGAMRCPPSGYSAQLVVGILRCAAVLDDQGRAPSSARMTADAAKVHRDRAIVQEALRCCYLADADPGTYVIGTWTPLGPQGGCVGGSTPIQVAVPACRCPEDEY
jgi:hypothetical protein